MPVVCVAQPGVTTMLQAKAAQPEPSSVRGGRLPGWADGGGRTQGVLSRCGNRTGLRTHVTCPPTAGGSTPEELLLQEGST